MNMKRAQEQREEVFRKTEERSRLNQEIEKTKIVIANKKETLSTDNKAADRLKEQIKELENLKFDEAVWSKIARPLGFDAGMRTLERTIEGIVRKVAYKIVSGQGKNFVVNENNLKEFL